MPNEKESRNVIIRTVEELTKLKDIYFQKKKGEGLERLSTPRDSEEAASLGDFGATVNLIGNGVKGVARAMNYFAGNECNFLSDFVDDVYRSSASKQFKRGLAVRDIIQNVHPDVNVTKGSMPTPEGFGYIGDKDKT